MLSAVFWGEVIDKFITINKNSEEVFTDYEILILVHKGPIYFYYSVNNCDVTHSIFISVRG